MSVYTKRKFIRVILKQKGYSLDKITLGAYIVIKVVETVTDTTGKTI